MNTNNETQTVNILIVGAGFAGVACARRLVRQNNVTVTILSDSEQFQYYPAIFRSFGSRNRIHSQLPLKKMLPDECIVITEKVVSVDIENNSVMTESGTAYSGDYVVLCTGMQICYFNIPGMLETALPLRSTNDAIHLTNHIDELFSHYHNDIDSSREMAFRFVIVGAGPAGCEIAVPILQYAKTKAREYNVPETFVRVEIVESKDRILSNLSEKTAQLITNRLISKGITIRVNSMVKQGQDIMAQLENDSIQTRTIVWSAGISPTDISQHIDGLEYDNRGKILVDVYMLAMGSNTVYIAGDIAATPKSGLAQTAIYDANYIADDIIRRCRNSNRIEYVLPKTSSIVPTDRGYGVVETAGYVFSGYIGWAGRAFADLIYYWSVLPTSEFIQRLRGIL
jgi:NADH:ubiquinone reductase (H+-translocating)